MNIIILGAGLIGEPIAVDLAKDRSYAVTGADINAAALQKLEKHHPIRTLRKDFSNPESVRSLVQDYDFVINALPGFMGYQTLHYLFARQSELLPYAASHREVNSLTLMQSKSYLMTRSLGHKIW